MRSVDFPFQCLTLSPPPPAEASTLQTALDSPPAGGGGGYWLIPLSRYYSFTKLLRVWRNVLHYMKVIKNKVAIKKNKMYRLILKNEM